MRRVRRGVLVGILLLLVVRLGLFVAAVHETSLQMDLSSFYAAGLAIGRGLSPYVNHVEDDPPIWDGVDRYRHSRFLYPPLAARLFQLLTWLDYHRVKLLWMLGSLLATAAAVWLALRAVGLGRSPEPLLVAGIIVAGFHPVWTLLERGQIDALTLLLIVVALTLCRGPRADYGGGALLALATLLKLHCLFLLPFLLLLRRLRVVAGFAAGAVALLLAGLALDGYGSWRAYVTQEMPRISRYGEGGSRDMRLPPDSYRNVLRGVERGYTVMDGRAYRPQYFEFVLNASLVRTPLGRATWNVARGAGLPLAPGHVSLVFLAVGFTVVLLLLRPRRAGTATAVDEAIYWQLALVLILLCAPVTWAMNVVWLLPTIAILAACRVDPIDRFQALGWLACAAGLALAALPDALLRAVVAPADFKYVVAELSCLVGLLVLARRRAGAATGS